MNTNKPNHEPFETLLDSYVQELISTSDAGALDGADPALLQKEGHAMIARARVESGKRRLAKAKLRLAAQESVEAGVIRPQVSAQEVRAFLQSAANDKSYTLAARGLEEMSDADALLLYLQLKKLEDNGEDTGNDSP